MAACKLLNFSPFSSSNILFRRFPFFPFAPFLSPRTPPHSPPRPSPILTPLTSPLGTPLGSPTHPLPEIDGLTMAPNVPAEQLAKAVQNALRPNLLTVQDMRDAFSCRP